MSNYEWGVMRRDGDTFPVEIFGTAREAVERAYSATGRAVVCRRPGDVNWVLPQPHSSARATYRAEVRRIERMLS